MEISTAAKPAQTPVERIATLHEICRAAGLTCLDATWLGAAHRYRFRQERKVHRHGNHQVDMRHLASLILVGGTTSFSMAFGQTTIDEMKTQGDIQGLFEVREAARAFVVAQNARQQTNWAALEPDLRAVVPKCLAPLKTRWKDSNQKTLEPVAVVICKKPTKAFGSGKPWVLEVPVLILPPSQRG